MVRIPILISYLLSPQRISFVRLPPPFRIPRPHMLISSACQGYSFENVPLPKHHVASYTYQYGMRWRHIVAVASSACQGYISIRYHWSSIMLHHTRISIGRDDVTTLRLQLFFFHTLSLRHIHVKKPEAATAVTELLMMGGKTPETCWAINKRQDNKLKIFCIRLVIYLN